MLRTINRRKSLRDPYFDECVLRAHLDGDNNGTSFIDHSKYKRTLTRVGTTAVTSTAQSKFGGASYSNNGSASYLTSSDDDAFDFAGNDFTVEFWTRLAASGNRLLVGRQNANVVVPWTINVGGLNLQFWVSFDNSAWAGGTYLAQVALSTNTWYHVAMCRSGTDFRCFVGGTQVGSTYTSSSSLTNSTRPLMIGSQGSTLHHNGNLDEIGIYNGAGLYAGNFTPRSYANFNN